ncbi:MAG: photosynthetic protein synthase I [Bdellovibrio sp. CG12_big_fil_rev_8_21_14_0_65_39_13]|nr:MAG: photosynthetic protein synthase I [Bdellovibrio sp. CG22_combo_CG10-13_8_21_14_all_39_27]PIQ61706.1 MAG: photosynthetic protein synthase I [Bdellovibrio sp. CG12_big_fil_rev_8_21_14_0_65_39_13]PIR35649.1 MAG: photosynthetic protein synthase I [Bdellovibrio sp. CG11_big_fil_rev_8_21_14_0_20_39_38]
MMTKAPTFTFVRDDKLSKLVSNKLFWLLFLIIVFSYPIIRSMYRELPPELPKYFQLKEYSLINEFNQPFGSKNLKGKAYLATFAFTSCPTTCPGLMEKMQVVQKRLKGLGTKVGMVTYSVDPANDTPQVLHKYARSLHANPYVWNFVTGDKKDLEALLIDGFKVPMGDREEVTKKLDDEKISLFDIVHTEKVVLVDAEGFIRGYYSVDKQSLDKLMIDLGLLINRQYN